MADEDYGDDAAFYFDDDDYYLYVEDDYAIADELAETQVPSPGYAGVNDEIAMEGFEYDVYDYFGELEYGSDSYWDARIKHLDSVAAGEKRKPAVGAAEEDTGDRLVKKRRKEAGAGGQEVADNVLYVPFEARLAPLPPRIPRGERQFALLPDWKERFPERAGEGSPAGRRKQMPAEMRKAAEEKGDYEEDEDEDEDMSAEPGYDEDEMETGEEGGFEEHDEDGDGEEEGTGGVDPDLVMQVLRQKLADSGLGDIDESVFKDVIAKMMSGDGDSEDAVGGLASLLLGQEGGGGKAFEGFLAGHGVELGSAEGDDDGKGEGEGEGDDNETNSRTKNTPKAKSASKSSQKPSATNSSSAKPTSKTPPRRTSRAKSKHAQTATFQSPSPTRTSPIVVPSPPPPAASIQPSRKRRAPSLDEPSIPQPLQAATATSSSKPPAKRRRATPARAEPLADEPEHVPVGSRRTTRSAAGKKAGN